MRGNYDPPESFGAVRAATAVVEALTRDEYMRRTANATRPLTWGPQRLHRATIDGRDE